MDLITSVRAYDRRIVEAEVSSRLERTPRGKTPLIVHRPPVHEVLRGHGLEPLFTR